MWRLALLLCLGWFAALGEAAHSDIAVVVLNDCPIGYTSIHIELWEYDPFTNDEYFGHNYCNSTTDWCWVRGTGLDENHPETYPFGIHVAPDQEYYLRVTENCIGGTTQTGVTDERCAYLYQANDNIHDGKHKVIVNFAKDVFTLDENPPMKLEKCSSFPSLLRKREAPVQGPLYDIKKPTAPVRNGQAVDAEHIRRRPAPVDEEQKRRRPAPLDEEHKRRRPAPLDEAHKRRRPPVEEEINRRRPHV